MDISSLVRYAIIRFAANNKDSSVRLRNKKSFNKTYSTRVLLMILYQFSQFYFFIFYDNPYFDSDRVEPGMFLVHQAVPTPFHGVFVEFIGRAQRAVIYGARQSRVPLALERLSVFRSVRRREMQPFGFVSPVSRVRVIASWYFAPTGTTKTRMPFIAVARSEITNGEEREKGRDRNCTDMCFYLGQRAFFF